MAQTGLREPLFVKLSRIIRTYRPGEWGGGSGCDWGQIKAMAPSVYYEDEGG